MVATVDVIDAHAATITLNAPLPPGRAAAVSSRPVALSTEDAASVAQLHTDLIAPTPAGTNVIGHVIVDTAPTTAITAAALPLPALAATSTKQSDGTQKTQVVDGSGNIQPSGDVVARALFEKITDGTNTATVKAASTAPVVGDTAIVVAISPNSVNANGRALPGASAPVVLNSMTYTPVAALQTAAKFGATGATGDYLDTVWIIPAIVACGAVTLTDGTGTAFTIFAGGGTTPLPSTIPFPVALSAISKNGAGGWQVTTGAGVSVVGVGNFT